MQPIPIARMYLLSPRLYLVSLTLLGAVLLSPACGPFGRGRVDKNMLNAELSKNLSPGMHRSEVEKYIDNAVINGVRGKRGEFRPASSEEKGHSSEAKEVEISGRLTVDFKGNPRFLDHCSGAFAIMEFDRTDRLVGYVVDCIY